MELNFAAIFAAAPVPRDQRFLFSSRELQLPSGRTPSRWMPMCNSSWMAALRRRVC